jgi:hypothetical protein
MNTLIWAARIMTAKNSIPRREPSFRIDLDGYGADDYASIIPSLKEAEQQLAAVPASKDGMRWIHSHTTVLFQVEHTVSVPYDEWVARVPIDHAGRFYRDSLGLATRVVTRDPDGRPDLQAVRVVALPQPNYAAFMGKAELDVYKLEKVERTADEQRVWMRTVHSPNGSAVCDDGHLSFRRLPAGNTLVTFLACQHFPAPPLMGVLGLDRIAWFKRVVTESAYRRFSRTMMRNLEDCYHGVEFDVGRAVSPVAG